MAKSDYFCQHLGQQRPLSRRERRQRRPPWLYGHAEIINTEEPDETGTTYEVRVDPRHKSAFNERFADLSPDGKWMAYNSDESGRNEVYVQSFPIPGNKYQVSTGGGFGGFWRQDGREIVFGGSDGQTMMSVDVPTGSEFHAGIPHVLARLPADLLTLTAPRDVQRVLLIVPAGGTGAASLTVVLDWPGALARP